jgi:hypothetical protein
MLRRAGHAPVAGDRPEHRSRVLPALAGRPALRQLAGRVPADPRDSRPESHATTLRELPTADWVTEADTHSLYKGSLAGIGPMEAAMRKLVGMLAAAVVVLAGVGACGGGGGGGSALVPTNSSPGGIWDGTVLRTGQQVRGLVTETGQFHFILADHTQYIGNLTVSGMSASGSFDAFPAPGSAFPDGSRHATGTVSATVQERAALTATLQLKTDAGTSFSDTLSLAFNRLYNRPSSIAGIAGNFSEAGTGAVFTLSSDGQIFAQDPTSKCVITGTVSLINATYNAYGVSISFASCIGQFAVLNGAQLTGVGALDNTVTPEQAIIGLSGTAAGTKLALVEVLTRT